MIDYLHIPKPKNGGVDIFTANSNSTTTGTWQTWNKPRGTSFVHITCIGGGGGGGGGASSTSGTRGGGGGGGSSAGLNVLIPSLFLPDRLYVLVGIGGAGGAAGSNGTSGTSSTVTIAPGTSAIYTICTSNNGLNATGGSASSNGSGATTSSVNTITSSFIAGYGFYSTGPTTNTSGAAGGANLTYPLVGNLQSGGAGGAGGFATNGGSITNSSQADVYEIIPSLFSGGTGGSESLIAGQDGSDGINNFDLFVFTGGTGGGSGFDTTAGAIGGNGGDAGIGCGGGGGGAGITGGRGGRGGDGLVVISYW